MQESAPLRTESDHPVYTYAPIGNERPEPYPDGFVPDARRWSGQEYARIATRPDGEPSMFGEDAPAGEPAPVDARVTSARNATMVRYIAADRLPARQLVELRHVTHDPGRLALIGERLFGAVPVTPGAAGAPLDPDPWTSPEPRLHEIRVGAILVAIDREHTSETIHVGGRFAGYAHELSTRHVRAWRVPPAGPPMLVYKATEPAGRRAPRQALRAARRAARDGVPRPRRPVRLVAARAAGPPRAADALGHRALALRRRYRAAQPPAERQQPPPPAPHRAQTRPRGRTPRRPPREPRTQARGRGVTRPARSGPRRPPRILRPMPGPRTGAARRGGRPGPALHAVLHLRRISRHTSSAVIAGPFHAENEAVDAAAKLIRTATAGDRIEPFACAGVLLGDNHAQRTERTEELACRLLERLHACPSDFDPRATTASEPPGSLFALAAMEAPRAARRLAETLAGRLKPGRQSTSALVGQILLDVPHDRAAHLHADLWPARWFPGRDRGRGRPRASRPADARAACAILARRLRRGGWPGPKARLSEWTP